MYKSAHLISCHLVFCPKQRPVRMINSGHLIPAGQRESDSKVPT